MARKKEESRFIDSVPEVIEKVRSFKDKTMSNPEIPFPWPAYVPNPELLDLEIANLASIYEARDHKEAETGGELGRARKRVKTRFSQLVRHVALALEGESNLAQWPGFDLGRNPGECRCRTPHSSASAVKVEDESK